MVANNKSKKSSGKSSDKSIPTTKERENGICPVCGQPIGGGSVTDSMSK